MGIHKSTSISAPNSPYAIRSVPPSSSSLLYPLGDKGSRKRKERLFVMSLAGYACCSLVIKTHEIPFPHTCSLSVESCSPLHQGVSQVKLSSLNPSQSLFTTNLTEYALHETPIYIPGSLQTSQILSVSLLRTFFWVVYRREPQLKLYNTIPHSTSGLSSKNSPISPPKITISAVAP